MPLKVVDLNYIYNEGTTLESYAVKGVNFEINKGEFVGIIGRTGSGKSTLIQQLNGLLKPTRGKIYFDGMDIHEKGFSLKDLRQKVGLVFQYPEYQLFEETVLQDVMYGPKNQGLTADEARDRAVTALKLTGLDNPDIHKKSPFELSGGQKRRVAIAGVIAMQPDYLILDEPTAGLDPQGRDEIFELIENMRRETGMASILVSHSMEDVARYVERLLVLDHGSLVYDASPREVFSHAEDLEAIGLSAPQAVYIAQALGLEGNLITVDEVFEKLTQK